MVRTNVNDDWFLVSTCCARDPTKTRPSRDVPVVGSVAPLWPSTSLVTDDGPSGLVWSVTWQEELLKSDTQEETIALVGW